jgi:hypothetical protein
LVQHVIDSGSRIGGGTEIVVGIIWSVRAFAPVSLIATGAEDPVPRQNSIGVFDEFCAQKARVRDWYELPSLIEYCMWSYQTDDSSDLKGNSHATPSAAKGPYRSVESEE